MVTGGSIGRLENGGDEENLPSYMRRPICAACNRNVKVVSSSETTTSTTQSQHQPHNSASNSSGSSRRSSVSATATTTNNRRRTANHGNKVAATSFSTTSSTATIHSDSSSSHGRCDTSNSCSRPRKHTTAAATMSTTPASASISNKNHSSSSSLNRRGAQSPTSPIPTVVHHHKKKKKNALIAETMTDTNDNSLQRQMVLSTATEAVGEDKWKYLLAQQQVLLTTLLRDENEDEEDKNTRQLLLHLSSSNHTKRQQKQYETILLETQIKILQKLTQLIQNRPSPSYDNCFGLNLQSSRFNYQYNKNTASNEAVNVMVAHNQSNHSATAMSTSWQTKIEYSLAKFRWGVSQWLGNLVGTGDIENQAYDALGYPEQVTITGVCVTSEPALLPKVNYYYYCCDGSGSSGSSSMDILDRPWL
ncbi:hypothetical protein BDF20DRAFT_718506 [Mycotypha africana]|uniref:uncharacterized protein n=1 Tax=Mycotypha africana TaxID=64632 RepID=UPI002300DF72|nr:uncharacterized protein BDF20DRAFT_718506 [Mycotypha africana]KAI8972056.1 hypothetical protein BDF20DRAFT_718506 [Mycotypha africana]